MLVMIAGDYKSGKTVSSITFPKPLLFLDFDDGFSGIKYLNKDISQITYVPLYHHTPYPLELLPKTAPNNAKEAVKIFDEYNKIISELASTGKYNDIKYETLVIDSLSEFFKIWINVIFSMTNKSALEIQHYRVLDNTLNNQFFKSLKALIASNIVSYVVCTNHVETEVDEVTKVIMEYPVGPSKSMGKEMGKYFDEIFRMRFESGKYVWRTKRTGFFQAGSRLNLPDPIDANYSSIEKHLKAN